MRTNNQAFAEKIAEKLNLQLESTQKRGEYAFRYQVAILKDKKGNKFILKLLTSENLLDKKSFFNEEKFFELAKENKLGSFVPQLIKAEIKKPPFWYLREYLSYSEAGNIVSDFGFQENFLKSINSEIFAAFLEQTWLFGEREAVQREFPIARSEEMPEYLVRSFEYNRKFLDRRIIIGVKKISEKFAEVMRCSFFVFAHNDLYPGNILYKENDLKVMDWERCGYHYPLADAAFVELLSWSDIKWQEDFKALVLKKFHQFGKRAVGNSLEHISSVYWGVMSLFWTSRLLSHCLSMARKFERSGEKKGKKMAMDFANYLHEKSKLTLAAFQK